MLTNFLSISYTICKMPKPANQEKPRCPKCKSAWTYYRLQREEYICRTCKYVWKDDNIEPKEVKDAATNAAKDLSRV